MKELGKSLREIPGETPDENLRRNSGEISENSLAEIPELIIGNL